MKIKELFSITESFAPVSISNEFCSKYNAKDNSGIIVETSKDINKVLFALDLTLKAVDFAIKNGCDAIITHHPAIYYPLYSISQNSPLYKAIKNDIGVISCHLNLDAVNGGIDDLFAKGLKGKVVSCVYELSNGASYGKISEFNGVTCKELIDAIKSEFNAKRILFYGNDSNKIYKLASFCGAGLSESDVENVDADVYVSADVKHSAIVKVLDKNKNLIVLTHYASEIYGFKQFYYNVSKKLDVKSIIFEEDYYL